MHSEEKLEENTNTKRRKTVAFTPVEENNMTTQILRPIIHRVKPDGDCLYNSFLRGYPTDNNIELRVATLRNAVADSVDDEELFFHILTEASIGSLDGYHSLIHQHMQIMVNLIEIDTNAATDYLVSNNLIEIYREAIRSGDTWGDELSIRVLSRIYNVAISITQYGNNGNLITSVINEGNSTDEPISLWYNREGLHYDYLVELGTINSNTGSNNNVTSSNSNPGFIIVQESAISQGSTTEDTESLDSLFELWGDCL